MFYSESLPKSSRSAAAARRVLDRLEGEVHPAALANARLLVSELIANAVEHVPGEGDIGLEIELENGTLRIEVRDSGGGFRPRPRGPHSDDGSGWGLHFVQLLSDRWATDADGGHRVWFELSAR